jgi:hypothetical protein
MPIGCFKLKKRLLSSRSSLRLTLHILLSLVLAVKTLLCSRLRLSVFRIRISSCGQA